MQSKALLFSFLPSLMLLGCTKEKTQEKPNILVILLDDAGYNDFGFMGSKDLLTPNIDALAKSGTILDNGYVSATVSGPSRCGLLTGRYQQRGGYECNLGDTLGMNLEEQTIANVLKTKGYITSCIGKWHQGDAPAYHPNQRGFDHFLGFINGSRSYFYNPKTYDRSDAKNSYLQLNGKQQHFKGKYLTDVLTDGAINFMKENEKSTHKPFFMYLAYNAVHTPMGATPEDLARFKGHKRQMLAAMTWAVDRGVGKVIDHLRATKQLENTLIFFLSDNGGAFTNTSSNYPLKGFKGNQYEGGMHVPFFCVWGKQIPSSQHYNGISSSLDIMPTLLAAANIDTTQLKKPLDGINLLPYLKGEKSSQTERSLYWRMNDRATVRKGNYKYIRIKGLAPALYNLTKDQHEDNNLASTHPEKIKSLNQELCQWEKGLVYPLLWNNGIWNKITIEIHRDLLHNKPVRFRCPSEMRKWQEKQKKN